jgi:hypothetical protein
MKWFHLLLLAVIVLPFTACEKHPASDLTLIGVSLGRDAGTPQGKETTETGKASGASGTTQPFFPDSK